MKFQKLDIDGNQDNMKKKDGKDYNKNEKKRMKFQKLNSLDDEKKKKTMETITTKKRKRNFMNYYLYLITCTYYIRGSLTPSSDKIYKFKLDVTTETCFLKL